MKIVTLLKILEPSGGWFEKLFSLIHPSIVAACAMLRSKQYLGISHLTSTEDYFRLIKCFTENLSDEDYSTRAQFEGILTQFSWHKECSRFVTIHERAKTFCFLETQGLLTQRNFRFLLSNPTKYLRFFSTLAKHQYLFELGHHNIFPILWKQENPDSLWRILEKLNLSQINLPIERILYLLYCPILKEIATTVDWLSHVNELTIETFNLICSEKQIIRDAIKEDPFQFSYIIRDFKNILSETVICSLLSHRGTPHLLVSCRLLYEENILTPAYLDLICSQENVIRFSDMLINLKHVGRLSEENIDLIMTHPHRNILIKIFSHLKNFDINQEEYDHLLKNQDDRFLNAFSEFTFYRKHPTFSSITDNRFNFFRFAPLPCTNQPTNTIAKIS